MRKRLLLILSLISTVLLLSAIFPSNITYQALSVSAQEQLQTRKVSLGGSLDQTGINYTLQLLNAQDVPAADQIYIDGPMINSYLRDGSTAQTNVYSSAIIEPRQPGYGVQIQIITPQTILNVSPATYQNAAITSGARDVLIKIASAFPVTGEGALTGVYAIYEANGNKLNQANIDVAQKEISLPNEIKQRVRLTDAQINEMLTNIKKAITAYIEENESISDDTLRALIREHVDAIAKKYNVTIPPEVVDVIFNVMKEFAALETERLKDVIDDSYQESWNLEQAIDIFEFAMDNIHTPSATSLPENYDPTQWKEISREGRTTILQYADLYYRFDKYEVDTSVKIGESTDNLEEDYLVSYVINNNSHLILSQHNPPLLPVDNYGDPVPINEDTAVEFARHVLFPSFVDEVEAPLNTIDSDTGAFVVLFVRGAAQEYLGAYRVYPDGKIDHLENYRLSGYPVKIPTLPIPPGEAYFDEAKEQELAQYMDEWGQAMNQDYIAYYPGQEGDMFGLTFPSEVIENFAAGEVETVAYWSEDGVSNNPGDFAVVAAYSDFEHFFATNPSEPAGAHYYLFVFVDGQPIVMHSQQNEGQPSGLVHFYQTENVALQQAFEQIAQGLGAPSIEVEIPSESVPEEETSQPEESVPSEESSEVETDTETEEETSEPPMEEDETSVEEDVESEPEEGETPPETGPLFDSNKNATLADFMNQWGQVMGQSYESFSPSQPSDMYGVNFPSDVISLLAVDGQAVPAYWSQDGLSIESGDYAIVAAYHNYQDFSEQNPEEPFGANFYLFVLVNEQPVVLVSQQNQGQPDGLIHFQPTENVALQEGFSQIIEDNTFNLQ